MRTYRVTHAAARVALLLAGASAGWSQIALPVPPGMLATQAGIFRQGFSWIQDVNGDGLSNVPPDHFFAFGGIAGDIPVVGNWSYNYNGKPYAKIGIFRGSNGSFLLDSNGDGAIDVGDPLPFSIMNALPGDVPVVGDWNGTGTSKLGFYRPSSGTWFLDYSGTQSITQTYQFGGIQASSSCPGGDVPVTGKWDASSSQTRIGVFRCGYLWVLDKNGDGQMDSADGLSFGYGGSAGDLPVTGDWGGTGITRVGIFRNGYLWFVDTNGDQVQDSADWQFAYGGIAGDIPVTGNWVQQGIPVTPDASQLTVNGSPGGSWSLSPNAQAPFVFTFHDWVNGGGDIAGGQIALVDQGGGLHCNLTWDGPQSLTLSDTSGFCTASLVSAGTTNDPSALAVTIDLTFSGSANGTYTVQSLVNDLQGDSSSLGTMGTVTIVGGGPTTYTISGTVMLAGGSTGLPGATVSMTGTATGAVQTASAGSYSFTVPAGSYTVSVAMSGYSFSPGTWTDNSLNSNQSSVNFSGGPRVLGPLSRQPGTPSYCSNSGGAILNNGSAQELGAFCIGFSIGTVFYCNPYDSGANTSNFSVSGSGVTAAFAGSPSQCTPSIPSSLMLTSRPRPPLHRPRAT